MSKLPKYRRVAAAEDLESASLVKGDGDERFSNEETVYPPSSSRSAGTLVNGNPWFQPGEEAVRSSGECGEVKSTVTYTFVPRWPVNGTKQHVIGVLGPTRKTSIAVVQQGIPALAAYAPDQIEILAPINPNRVDVEGDEWGLVMDDAWASFICAPPKCLKVQIRDKPGDDVARRRREHLIVFGWLAACIGVLAMIGLTTWALTKS